MIFLGKDSAAVGLPQWRRCRAAACRDHAAESRVQPELPLFRKINRMQPAAVQRIDGPVTRSACAGPHGANLIVEMRRPARRMSNRANHVALLDALADPGEFVPVDLFHMPVQGIKDTVV